MRFLRIRLAMTGTLLFAVCAGAQKYQFPFQDPALPVADRVNDLVGRLTLDEKISQLPETAAAIPRLGVPEYTWWNEALHGVALSGYATVFPQAIGLAATWDAALMRTVGDTISTEARAKNNDAIAHGNRRIFFGLTFWSPNINIFRDPRWGRGQETYGEDPFLTGSLGSAFVEGMQGNDSKFLKVVATPKHFAVHSGPELLRHGFNVDVSPADLEGTYLPAFRAAVVGGKAASIMCSYNAVDQVPACSNQMLLSQTLRQDWGFGGFVTSDCGAIDDIWQGHHAESDREHAAAAALRAGTDTSCGDEFLSLKKAIEDRLVSVQEIDTAVTRLFTARFRLGMFDPPASYRYGRIPITDNDSQANRNLALEAAEKSMVLLKNANHILPLSSAVKSIAVVGPNAADLSALEGNYHGTSSHPVLPLDGMEARFHKTATMLYAQGSTYVNGFPVVVPRSALRTGQVEGLKAEFFNNLQWQGQPVTTRVDKQVDFNWNAVSPAAGVSAKAFSVRWSGTITAPAAGEIPFKVSMNCTYPRDSSGTEEFRLYLDGSLVGENSCNATISKVLSAFPVKFLTTGPHRLRLEYAHDSPMFDAEISLAWEPDAAAMRREAVAAAQKADLVVALMGLTPRFEGEEMRSMHLEGFDGGDRSKIDLPETQRQLLESLASTGKPLVLVLLNGGAVSVPWAKQHASAILEAWYPGEEGGAAIAATLAGDNNPAGRLPVTVYASLAQLPRFSDYSMKGRTYRYMTVRPQYGFGFGLSYSTFSYSHLKLSSAVVEAGKPLTVDVDLQNTSVRGGEEVAELYLSGGSLPGAPVRSLRGFQRVKVEGGKKIHLHFVLDARSLSLVDRQGERAVRAGMYEISVGSGQPGESPGLKQSFQIKGGYPLPR